ncbi:MAG: redoxin domain-containing protein [Methanomassiliicoccales archaeon]
MESSTLRLGDIVPDFELPDERGRPYRLSQAVKEGPLVIIFFPSVWGMMCAVEMSTFRDMMPQFVKVGARLCACDTNSPMSNAAWKEQMRLEFPLLSDFDGTVAAKFGILCGEEGYMKGRSNRAIFIIDDQMRARYIWVADDPSFEPDYDLVLKVATEVAAEVAQRRTSS